MSRIFLSHSSAENAQAIAVRDWMSAQGWDDVFLDLDPQRGIAPGERWERALNAAVGRCEAVLFLVSGQWLASKWCQRELLLAHKLNKRLFGIVIEGVPRSELPPLLTDTWQTVSLVAGPQRQTFVVKLPVSGEEVRVAFSAEGLRRLKGGLQKAGLDARYFQWPPEGDPNRPPYRGLRPLEPEDAGIFFGREAAITTTLDTLRGLREKASPRILVILGASGAGKSSFLRAGLIPRLKRDDRNYITLPVVRPERAVLSGESGLAQCLAQAFEAAGIKHDKPELKRMLVAGVDALVPVLDRLVAACAPVLLAEETGAKRPTIVLSIDQGEELFAAYSTDESQRFFQLLRALIDAQRVDVMVIFTIRTDKYEPLQATRHPAGALEGLHQHTISLPPIPPGLYATLIEGPADRLKGTDRPLTIEPLLVQTLLHDVQQGDAKDALPLLAFTLERLFREFGQDGDLRISEYEQLGRIRGAIEAAVENALVAAEADPNIPPGRPEKLGLLRAGFIPWLAVIDPETQAPRRRVALMSEIPVRSAPLVRCLVEQRLLATDAVTDTRGNPTGEMTVEPAHEVLLRQWSVLQDWLEEDRAALVTLEGIRRAAHEWKSGAASAPASQPDSSDRGLLTHRGLRLAEAERVLTRPDFAAAAGAAAAEYLAACRAAENAAVAAAAERIAKERQQLARNRKLQRRGFVFLGAASVALLIGIAGVLAVVQHLNQRTSNTLAALAQQAYDEGYSDRAARYALAGMVGRDHWPVGFDATPAEEALSIERHASGSKAVLRGHARSVQDVAYTRDGARIVTASYDHTARIWDAATGALLHVLQGHRGKIERLALSPDDARIATASFDGTARIWDARNGDLLQVLEHGDAERRLSQVWCVAFSPNGRLLATGASDKLVRVWDAQTGLLLHVFAPPYPNEVHEIAFSRDGNQLLSTSEGGDARVWDVETGHQVYMLNAALETVKGGRTLAAFSPDGKMVVTGSANGNVTAWRADTGAMIKSLEPAHRSLVYSIAFDGTGRRMVTASSDKVPQVWDMTELRLLGELRGHESSVRHAIFSPDGSRIVTVSDDSTARTWDAGKLTPIYVFRGHEGRVWRVNFAPDGRTFVTASYDASARVWSSDVSIGRTDAARSIVLRGHTQAVRVAAFAPDGRFVATGSFVSPDHTARVFDAMSGELVAVLPVGDKIQAIAFSADGNYVATGSIDKFLAQVWEWRKCNTKGTIDCQTGPPLRHDNFVKDVAFSPDGKELLTASRDHFARLWRLSDRTIRLKFPLPGPRAIHPSGLNAAAFSPDGTKVLTGSFDDAWIWEATTGAAICELIGHSDAIRQAAFSRDGRRAVTASEDSTARIWDAENCARLAVFSLPNDSIWSANFSPNGDQLVIASEKNKSARIFDIGTTKEIAVLRGHESAVYTASFSPVDGRRVVTASDDKTARIWQVPDFAVQRGDALVRAMCTERLAAGLSVLTEKEILAAPVLNPALDRDPCHPASMWQRLLALFR